MRGRVFNEETEGNPPETECSMELFGLNIWWFIAVFCAFVVKGICGFANTPVMTSILSFSNSINNVNISPVDLLIGYPANIVMTVKERRSIKWKVCLPLIALVLLGDIPGTLLLSNSDPRVVKLVFGGVIILVAAEMLLRILKPGKMKENKIVLAVIALASGILCGLYGLGALLSGYISRVTEDTHGFKANICAVFFADNTFRVIVYLVTGLLTLEVARQALILLPFMLAGLFTGMMISKKVNEKPIKIFVILMLAVSGAVLIASNL